MTARRTLSRSLDLIPTLAPRMRTINTLQRKMGSGTTKRSARMSTKTAHSLQTNLVSRFDESHSCGPARAGFFTTNPALHESRMQRE